MGTMFDTTDAHPSDALSGLDVEAVAAYRNGSFANSTAAKQEYPKAHHLEIDVKGEGIGDAGDFETGDMPYTEAGPWARRRIEAGVSRPVIYFEVSKWGQAIDSLKAAGVHRDQVRLWTAHYTGQPHLCSDACRGFGVTGRADATQWGSPPPQGSLPHPYTGRHIDVSSTADDFWRSH